MDQFKLVRINKNIKSSISYYHTFFKFLQYNIFGIIKKKKMMKMSTAKYNKVSPNAYIILNVWILPCTVKYMLNFLLNPLQFEFNS